MKMVQSPGRVWLNSNIITGLLVVGIGSLVVASSRGYEIGGSSSMGPGYFPRLLGILLVLFGAAAALVGVLARADERDALTPGDAGHLAIAFLAIAAFPLALTTIGRFGLTGLDHALLVLVAISLGLGRRTFFVMVSLVAFALLLRPLGLVLTSFATVGLATLAVPDFRSVERVIITLSLSTASALIFVVGLRLPINLWPNVRALW